MKRFEPFLAEERPDAVIVVGDVNSTVACALTSVKMGIPVAHVEAGLRSFDRTMPEEINRVVTDAISQWLFVSEPSGVANLEREGIPAERIYFVGNVMIETLIACRKHFESISLSDLRISSRNYAVLTLHRPSNVDDPVILRGLLRAIDVIQRQIPVIFPVHPRTRKALAEQAVGLPNLQLIEPLGYFEFMKLVSDCRFVFTDSGGIQEETTYLGVPCLTLRKNTERPVTVDRGTNQLAGNDPDAIIAAVQKTLSVDKLTRHIPLLWDGHASVRILDVFEQDHAKSSV